MINIERIEKVFDEEFWKEENIVKIQWISDNCRSCGEEIEKWEQLNNEGFCDWCFK